MRTFTGRPTTIASTLCVSALMLALATACAPSPPVVATVDTLCVSTTRYHATEPQIAAFKASPAVWQPLVDWLFGFNKVRDERCLKPSPF